jgi:hypothetical protein
MYTLDWWPSHVRKALRSLGLVLGPAQLKPEDLARVDARVLPGHDVLFLHKSGRELGTRKGVYYLSIGGPVFAGEWSFSSGNLENLARAAAKAAAE